MLNRPWVILGDFNEILFSYKKQGGEFVTANEGLSRYVGVVPIDGLGLWWKMLYLGVGEFC